MRVNNVNVENACQVRLIKVIFFCMLTNVTFPCQSFLFLKLPAMHFWIFSQEYFTVWISEDFIPASCILFFINTRRVIALPPYSSENTERFKNLSLVSREWRTMESMAGKGLSMLLALYPQYHGREIYTSSTSSLLFEFLICILAKAIFGY